MTARNRAFCLLSCAVLVVEVSRATTITSGYVIFDNGVHTPDQRGWGRGISVDLVGIEPVFELTGGDADTSFVAPGVISDGFAFAPTSASLFRAVENGPMRFQDESGTYICPVFCLEAGILSFSTPGMALPTNPVSGTTYALTATFTLNSSHIALAGLGSSLGKGTLDEFLTGGGITTVNVGYRPIGGSVPIFYVESSQFVFTPEPSTCLLVLGAIGALLSVRRAAQRTVL